MCASGVGHRVGRGVEKRPCFRTESPPLAPTAVDSGRPLRQDCARMSSGRLQVLLLGHVRLLRDAEPVALPRSRKVLALLGYLALERGPRARSRLCDLLWDGPNDPRGELRWCLSKLRALVDSEGRPRVVSSGAEVALDLSDTLFDAAEVEQLALAGLGAASDENLAAAL